MTDWEKANCTGVVQCNSAVSLQDLFAASAVLSNKMCMHCVTLDSCVFSEFSCQSHK